MNLTYNTSCITSPGHSACPGAALTSFLLMPIFAQALLPLMGSDLMPLSFTTTRHEQLSSLRMMNLNCTTLRQRNMVPMI